MSLIKNAAENIEANIISKQEQKNRRRPQWASAKISICSIKEILVNLEN
jgi:hypothetical protein